MFDITRDFAGAEEKGLRVYYNDTSGEFEIECPEETLSFYDSCVSDDGGLTATSDGKALESVKRFIEEY